MPDLVEVYRCRGSDKRFSFALQLLVLRNCGRFLGDDFKGGFPVRILNHVGRQLGLPPLPLVSPPTPVRRRTTEYEQQIRQIRTSASRLPGHRLGASSRRHRARRL
jgi:hypothetical protein